jgi:hypothetical protein
MLTSALSLFNTLRVSKAHFRDSSNYTTGEIILLVIFLIVYLLLILYIGCWLFNTIICSTFCCKKLSNIWEFLGLIIVLHIILPY